METWGPLELRGQNRKTVTVMTVVGVLGRFGCDERDGKSEREEEERKTAESVHCGPPCPQTTVRSIGPSAKRLTVVWHYSG
jgi:ribosomal protein L37AE/L43A